MMDSGDDIKVEPVPSSQEIEMEQLTVKCELNPEPSMWRNEYTVDQLPAFKKELFGSSSYVLGTEFSQNTNYALMKSEYPAYGMGDSQGMRTENSESAVGQSFESNTANSECEADMGQSLGTDMTDSTHQIKIEPGSVCSLGETFEGNNDTYDHDTQGVVLKSEDKMNDIIVAQETNKVQEENIHLDSSLGMLEFDPDRVAKVEVVSMNHMVLWPVYPVIHYKSGY
jgi:hypothetical protein